MRQLLSCRLWGCQLRQVLCCAPALCACRLEMEQVASSEMEGDYSRAYAEFSVKHAQVGGCNGWMPA